MKMKTNQSTRISLYFLIISSWLAVFTPFQVSFSQERGEVLKSYLDLKLAVDAKFTEMGLPKIANEELIARLISEIFNASQVGVVTSPFIKRFATSLSTKSDFKDLVMLAVEQCDGDVIIDYETEEPVKLNVPPHLSLYVHILHQKPGAEGKHTWDKIYVTSSILKKVGAKIEPK
jgi:hypothetical protein